MQVLGERSRGSPKLCFWEGAPKKNHRLTLRFAGMFAGMLEELQKKRFLGGRSRSQRKW